MFCEDNRTKRVDSWESLNLCSWISVALHLSFCKGSVWFLKGRIFMQKSKLQPKLCYKNLCELEDAGYSNITWDMDGLRWHKFVCELFRSKLCNCFTLLITFLKKNHLYGEHFKIQSSNLYVYSRYVIAPCNHGTARYQSYLDSLKL